MAQGVQNLMKVSLHARELCEHVRWVAVMQLAGLGELAKELICCLPVDASCLIESSNLERPLAVGGGVPRQTGTNTARTGLFQRCWPLHGST